MRSLNWKAIAELDDQDETPGAQNTRNDNDIALDALLRTAKALEDIHLDLMEMTAKFVTEDGFDLADVLSDALLDPRDADSYLRDVAVSISYLQD